MTKTGGVNNPMNVRATHIRWLGETTKDGDAFESYDTVTNGVRSGARCLITANKNGFNTISKLIAHYAPPKENRTAAYAAFVAKAAGVDQNAVIALASNCGLLEKIVAAMAIYETGTHLDAATLLEACRAAIGL